MVEASRFRDEMFRLADEQELENGLCADQEESDLDIIRPKRNVGSRVLHRCDFCT